MNAYELLNLLEMNTDANGLPREGDNSLMFFTNQAISLLGHSQNTQNIIYDTATGRLPLLETREGVFDYEAPDNYWKINGIWVEFGVSGSLLDSIIPRDDYTYYSRTGYNKTEPDTLAGINYIKIPFTRSYDRGDNANARVLFTENPGDTTDIYRWYALASPNELLSDAMPLPIKPPYDIMFLFPAALELIRGSKSGKISEAIEYITSLAKKYSRKLSEGDQGVNNDATDRGF